MHRGVSPRRGRGSFGSIGLWSRRRWLERVAEVSPVWQTWRMATHPPADLRNRAVAAVHGGLPRAEVARAYGVHLRTLDTWLARDRRGEPLADRPRSGRPPKLPVSQHAAVRAVVAGRPDATLAEHADALADRTGVRLSRSRVGRLLTTLDLPLKKNADRPRPR